MTQSEKFEFYLSSYHLSITYLSYDEEDSSYIQFIIDKSFPEIVQKLNNLWMNKDIYTENTSKYVETVGDNHKNDSLYSWIVNFRTDKKCKSVMNDLIKSYPNDGLLCNHFIESEGKAHTINLRMSNKDLYIKTLSDILSKVCI